MTTQGAAYEGAARDAGKLPFPLQEQEHVIALCRRHWVYLWPRTVLLALYAIVPLAVIAWIMSAADAYDGVAAQIFWVAAAIWLLYFGLRMALNWYRYHNDIWVVTNQRIVDSVKTNPFSLELSTADLVNVQDMTIERRGILRTMLNYGDIVCQTAADNREFRLAGIPHPQEVQLLVDKERDRERMRARGG